MPPANTNSAAVGEHRRASPEVRHMATKDNSIPGRIQPWLGVIKRSLTILLLAYGVLRALGIA
ncbi:Uncharacterized protein SVXHr_1306 [Halorhabdus sp. SVX81]|nr:Uncharacterized protein SVXHr_1306 [Halorhabdus sp. SVX81]WEL21355.1 Uncharacterized protein HBNXHr_1290 [Halorhabdus sp. BNX81]